MFRQYWKFYWPLALTGLVLLAGKQAQNGVLAGFAMEGLISAAFARCSRAG